MTRISMAGLLMLSVAFLSCAKVHSNAQDKSADHGNGPATAEKSDADLKTFKDKSSYSIGYDIGRNLAAQEMSLDLSLVLKGLTEAYQGKEHPLDDEQLRAVMIVYMEELEKKEIEKWREIGRENLKKGESFLQKNRTVEGVKQFESGLQFKVIKQGDGKSPKIEDRVKVHVRSSNVDGQELDNSFTSGEPLEIAVGGSPRGWVEALQKMKVGDKWTIYVPAEQAYGPNGFPPLVGPNEALVFDIELLEIVK